MFVGSTQPLIDTATTTNDVGCVVDTGSYVLNPSAVNGIIMNSIGAITVPTSSAIAPTLLTISVTTNGGAETKTSSVF